MPLSSSKRQQLQGELAKASPSAIQGVMARVTRRWRRRSWLARNNRYLVNAEQRIIADCKAAGSLHYGPMSEYIAGSALVHCFDGWSYLGRALEAEMAGDPDATRHLGYYAELRAAMSMLATEGIGVFNQHHVVVGANARCHMLDTFGGTHAFVWHALELWAQSSVAVSAVLESISPGNVPLADWLKQFSIGGMFLATDWLTSWGLDLARLADDRSARNAASYRPNAFTSPGPRPVSDTIEGILRFWEVCDPESNGGFPVLDRYLLRRCISLGWQGSAASYDGQLHSALGAIAPTSPPVKWWRHFLSHQQLTKDHGIIRDASGTVDLHDPNHSKQVLARATLLLRVATGCSADLLRNAGPNVDADLDFWLSSRSVSRRLWHDSDPRTPSIDLWSDVEDASTSLQQWLASTPTGARHSHYALWRDMAKAAATLSTTERAFLWGVGL